MSKGSMPRDASARTLSAPAYRIRSSFTATNPFSRYRMPSDASGVKMDMVRKRIGFSECICCSLPRPNRSDLPGMEIRLLFIGQCVDGQGFCLEQKRCHTVVDFLRQLIDSWPHGGAPAGNVLCA